MGLMTLREVGLQTELEETSGGCGTWLKGQARSWEGRFAKELDGNGPNNDGKFEF